jgi:hypothetical protein
LKKNSLFLPFFLPFAFLSFIKGADLLDNLDGWKGARAAREKNGGRE